ncbi:MAG: helix-turn-helix domain-containing protein [Thermotogota bacterium]|nr:helix-turn-helix domain-containing protein [Thermotogota bacterium]
METVEALALVGGYVDEELLVRNEYLAAENEILKSKLERPVRFKNDERIKLAKIGKRMGIKALRDIACIVKPETIMKWFRELVAKKFDGSANRKKTGRPRIDKEIEALILRFAQENLDWGYDRIVGALSNLGYKVSDQTVGNILKRNGIYPAPKRRKDNAWAEFIKSHQNVLAGCDFFTTEVITPVGLITYYVLFFIHVGSRRVHIAGITPNPDEQWMKQIARNITMADLGFLNEMNCKYLIHDRDSKFCESFREIIKSAGIKPLRLPAKSPNLNSYSERWVRSAKFECLSKFIFFGEQSLRQAISEFIAHYHMERNHQGKDNILLFPSSDFNPNAKDAPIGRKSRLDGRLNYYYREAA